MGTVLAVHLPLERLDLERSTKQRREASNDASPMLEFNEIVWPRAGWGEQTVTCSVNQPDDSLDRRSKLIPSAGGVTPRRQETDGGQRSSFSCLLPPFRRYCTALWPRLTRAAPAFAILFSLFPSIVDALATRTNELSAWLAS